VVTLSHTRTYLPVISLRINPFFSVTVTASVTMPKVPQNPPKYLPMFFEHVKEKSKKSVVKAACDQMEPIFEKHWTEFHEINEAELAAKPKKPKKENPDKKAETAVKNLSKVFADVSPENQHEILGQMRDMCSSVVGGDGAAAAAAFSPAMLSLGSPSGGDGGCSSAAAASASASPNGHGMQEDTRTHLRQSLHTMSSHLSTMEQTLADARQATEGEEDSLSKPLIETTANVLRVFQQGMQDICETLNLDENGDQGANVGKAAKASKRGKSKAGKKRKRGEESEPEDAEPEDAGEEDEEEEE
jgi:hypothetical protein